MSAVYTYLNKRSSVYFLISRNLIITIEKIFIPCYEQRQRLSLGGRCEKGVNYSVNTVGLRQGSAATTVDTIHILIIYMDMHWWTSEMKVENLFFALSYNYILLQTRSHL